MLFEMSSVRIGEKGNQGVAKSDTNGNCARKSVLNLLFSWQLSSGWHIIPKCNLLTCSCCSDLCFNMYHQSVSALLHICSVSNYHLISVRCRFFHYIRSQSPIWIFQCLASRHQPWIPITTVLTSFVSGLAMYRRSTRRCWTAIPTTSVLVIIGSRLTKATA